MSKHSYILIGITLILAALACNISEDAASDSSGTPTPELPAPQNSSASDLTQTHTDSTLGIAFNYPDGWRIEGTPGQLIQVLSPPGSGDNPRPQADSFPEDETKIEFIPSHPSNPYATIDEWIAYSEQPSQGAGGNLISSEKITLPSGIPAARGTFGNRPDGSENPVLVIDHNDQLIFITGYGDTTRFDEVVNTIRPL